MGIILEFYDFLSRDYSQTRIFIAIILNLYDERIYNNGHKNIIFNGLQTSEMIHKIEDCLRRVSVEWNEHRKLSRMYCVDVIVLNYFDGWLNLMVFLFSFLY